MLWDIFQCRKRTRAQEECLSQRSLSQSECVGEVMSVVSHGEDWFSLRKSAVLQQTNTETETNREWSWRAIWVVRISQTSLALKDFAEQMPTLLSRLLPLDSLPKWKSLSACSPQPRSAWNNDTTSSSESASNLTSFNTLLAKRTFHDPHALPTDIQRTWKRVHGHAQ